MGERLDTDSEWVDAMRDTHRVLARAQYADIEMLTAWFRRGAAADHARSGGLFHSVSEGMCAAVEAAAVLRMAESAVNRCVEIGLALDCLPHTKAAFAAGLLDVDRVRIIADVTACCTEEARLELDRRMAERGQGCAPGSLRSAGRRWAHSLDPDYESARRKRSVEDRDVRVRATASGMSVLDGWLPVEAAQTVAFRLADMARQDVCAADPRTFPQRRADALLALADGSGRLTCRCDHGDACPKAGAAATVSAGTVIQVGVSLETLLGLRQWPGYLEGAGAIDPDLARTLAVDGRWEWIIAAIDAAASQAGTGTKPAAPAAPGASPTDSGDGASSRCGGGDSASDRSGRSSGGREGSNGNGDSGGTSSNSNSNSNSSGTSSNSNSDSSGTSSNGDSDDGGNGGYAGTARMASEDGAVESWACASAHVGAEGAAAETREVADNGESDDGARGSWLSPGSQAGDTTPIEPMIPPAAEADSRETTHDRGATEACGTGDDCTDTGARRRTPRTTPRFADEASETPAGTRGSTDYRSETDAESETSCATTNLIDVTREFEHPHAATSGPDTPESAASESSTDPPVPDPPPGNPSPATTPRHTRTRSGSAARRAVTAACTTTGGWDDPKTPTAQRYQWPDSLARWIRARDGICRFPGCRVPATRCDIDHTQRFDHNNPHRGGPTTRANAACLCRRHHQLKTAGENGLNGWRVRQLGNGRLDWTTPTGEHVITEPEGAHTLWPQPDLDLEPPPPAAYDPALAAQIAAAAGFTLADDATLAAITANAPYWSTIEEQLAYDLDTFPPRTKPEPAPATTELDDDQPPPF